MQSAQKSLARPSFFLDIYCGLARKFWKRIALFLFFMCVLLPGEEIVVLCCGSFKPQSRKLLKLAFQAM